MSVHAEPFTKDQRLHWCTATSPLIAVPSEQTPTDLAASPLTGLSASLLGGFLEAPVRRLHEQNYQIH